MARCKQHPVRLLTNFPVERLPAYQEAIRRFGGRVRRTRITIGKPAGSETLRSLYVAGPHEDLGRFWDILRSVEAEKAKA